MLYLTFLEKVLLVTWGGSSFAALGALEGGRQARGGLKEIEL